MFSKKIIAKHCIMRYPPVKFYALPIYVCILQMLCRSAFELQVHKS